MKRSQLAGSTGPPKFFISSNLGASGALANPAKNGQLDVGQFTGDDHKRSVHNGGG